MAAMRQCMASLTGAKVLMGSAARAGNLLQCEAEEYGLVELAEQTLAM